MRIPLLPIHRCVGTLNSRHVVPRVSRIALVPRHYSTTKPSTITLDGKTYPHDDHTNVPPHIAQCLSRKLHLIPNHPISITRSLIESQFPSPVYKSYNTLLPVVTVGQNFDSLGFPLDHPGRSRTDTYYVNKDTVLRTHTSAHQADTFRQRESDGFTISADVYRRDAIDRSHYPVFHQMEGARVWSRDSVPNGDIAAAIWKEIEQMPKHDLKVEDTAGAWDVERNPVQLEHTDAEAEAVAAHLKRSLENVVVEVFGQARKAAIAVGEAKESEVEEPLKVRWIEAYFPFTSPSYELEVFWQGDWLELLGCGVVKQELLKNSDCNDQIGWAFGVGLERVSMLLFNIPDIRLFWSQDARFLSQFTPSTITRFQPFSKFPPCHKDVAFWLPSSTTSAAGGNTMGVFHENDMMEVVRDVAGDDAEDVRCIDEFVHPKTGKKSLCFRVNYRSLERTLTNDETNQMHEKVRQALVERYGVELR